MLLLIIVHHFRNFLSSKLSDTCKSVQYIKDKMCLIRGILEYKEIKNALLKICEKKSDLK